MFLKALPCMKFELTYIQVVRASSILPSDVLKYYIVHARKYSVSSMSFKEAKRTFLTPEWSQDILICMYHLVWDI